MSEALPSNELVVTFPSVCTVIRLGPAKRGPTASGGDFYWSLHPLPTLNRIRVNDLRPVLHEVWPAKRIS